MFLRLFQINVLNNVALMRKVKSQTVLRIFLSRSRSLLINILYISLHLHFVNSVQIRSYFCSEYRKIRTRNNSVFGHFSRSDMLKKSPNLSLYMLINVMLIKKTCTSNSFVAFPRLHATAVNCAHQLINEEC